jgi:hypothetical protein
MVYRITLNHEVGDDPVELGPVVVPPSSELGKVSAGLRGVLPVQLDDDLTHSKKTKNKSKFILEFVQTLVTNIILLSLTSCQNNTKQIKKCFVSATLVENICNCSYW